MKGGPLSVTGANGGPSDVDAAKRSVLNRLRRASGQLNAVIKAVETGRP